MGQQNLIEYAYAKYGNTITPSNKYYEYKKSIEDGKNLFCNTISQSNINNIRNNFINKILLHMKNNDKINSYESENNNYKIKFSDIQIDNVFFEKIEIESNIMKSIDMNKYYLTFIAKLDNTYKFLVKLETCEFDFRNKNRILFSDLISKNFICRYRKQLIEIIYDVVSINSKKYIIIDNYIYNIPKISIKTVTKIGEIKDGIPLFD